MLLLPLILWWAHAPMRFDNRRLRTAISIIIIALVVSPCGYLTPSIFADDRFSRDYTGLGIARSWDADDQRPNNTHKEYKQLREGTLIPPTVGQIVMLGRRWAFVPTAAESKIITITENLMLQRIVEAIRADASDDRWRVLGEVTEFFNENRLKIRTAQRANLN